MAGAEEQRYSAAMYSIRDAESMAAQVVPFEGDKAAWIDAFGNALGQCVTDSQPGACVAAGERAYATQGEFHPVIVANLESWLGPYRAE